VAWFITLSFYAETNATLVARALRSSFLLGNKESKSYVKKRAKTCIPFSSSSFSCHCDSDSRAAFAQDSPTPDFARYSLAKATRPDQNEDRILSLPRTSLGAVFDGVGGEDGYIGSLVASQTVRSHWKKVLSARQVSTNDEENDASNIDLLLLLEYVILQAHHRLCAESTRRTKEDGTPLRPCTTIALAAIDYQPSSS
jgi:hypothetical protein